MYEPTRPSFAARSAFFSAFAWPVSFRRALARSGSPSAQISALRTSEIPAPVSSRRRLISSAVGLYAVFKSVLASDSGRRRFGRERGVLLVVVGRVVRGLGLGLAFDDRVRDRRHHKPHAADPLTVPRESLVAPVAA